MTQRPRTTASPSRRTGAIALIFALAMGACSSSEADGTDAPTSTTAAPTTTSAAATTTAAQPDRGTLAVWTFAGSGVADQMQRWAAANGVVLELRTTPPEQHELLVQTALVSDRVPDVVVVDESLTALLKATPGEFIDLGRLGAAALAADHLPWRWDHGVASTDQTIIGLPSGIGGLAIAYRTDRFAEAGLPTDPSEAAALWPSWAAFAGVATRYAEAAGRPFLGETDLLIAAMLSQGGAGLTTADGTSMHDSNPTVVGAWNAAAAIAGGASGNLPLLSPEWRAAVDEGEFAAQIAPVWILEVIAAADPDGAGSWALTVPPGVSGNLGGVQLMIPRGAADVDLAWEMIAAISSPEAQLAAAGEGLIPSTPGVFDEPAVRDLTDAYFSDAPVGELYIASVSTLQTMFEGENDPFIMDELQRGLRRIASGQEDAAMAWATTLAAIAEELG